MRRLASHQRPGGLGQQRQPAAYQVLGSENWPEPGNIVSLLSGAILARNINLLQNAGSETCSTL